MKSSKQKSMFFHYIIHYICLPIILWMFSQSMINTIYTIQNLRMTVYLFKDIVFSLLILILAVTSFVGFFWRGYQSWRAILFLFPAVVCYQGVILIVMFLNHSRFLGITIETTILTLILTFKVLNYYKVRKSMFAHKISLTQLKKQWNTKHIHQVRASRPHAVAIQRKDGPILIEHAVIPCLQDLTTIKQVNRPTSLRSSPEK